MTFTYVAPSEEGMQAVRFLIGDTNGSEAYLQDEEIQWVYDRYFPNYRTEEYVASVCADTIAARYAREANYSADGVSIGLGAVAQQFRELAASLRQQHKNIFVGGSPDAGGMDIYDEQLDDTANFSFGTGMHDDREAGPQDYGSRPLYPYAPYEEPGT